ncbi:DUF4266 domain-containing protein [Marinagarivorans algicola]|uniref:DUF4266 domain-containing protein n=1 Tax=Marinagarivorans algicola TaxID=1513270 RepID=UPI0006B5852F|nr:DUF4266 domain-containing protein [Marinagarivorans algicola]
MKYTGVCTILCLLCISSGCTSVRFNEREQLSRSDMQFDAPALSSDLTNQIYQAREGASGVFSGGGGGGCGCY